jgi:hypothetical protein
VLQEDEVLFSNVAEAERSVGDIPAKYIHRSGNLTQGSVTNKNPLSGNPTRLRDSLPANLPPTKKTSKLPQQDLATGSFLRNLVIWATHTIRKISSEAGADASRAE